MPDSELFILFMVAGAIFTICCVIVGSLFLLARRRNSTVLEGMRFYPHQCSWISLIGAIMTPVLLAYLSSLHFPRDRGLRSLVVVAFPIVEMILLLFSLAILFFLPKTGRAPILIRVFLTVLVGLPSAFLLAVNALSVH
jgi:hypothetical protein